MRSLVEVFGAVDVHEGPHHHQVGPGGTTWDSPPPPPTPPSPPTQPPGSYMYMVALRSLVDIFGAPNVHDRPHHHQVGPATVGVRKIFRKKLLRVGNNPGRVVVVPDATDSSVSDLGNAAPLLGLACISPPLAPGPTETRPVPVRRRATNLSQPADVLLFIRNH